MLRHAVPAAVAAAGVDPAQVVGIATDFTACTMVPTTQDGTPLSDVAEVGRRAARLRQALAPPRRAGAGRPAQRRSPASAARSWLARYGGLISSEWEFAKGLQMLEEAPEVYAATAHFVEAADWIVWQLSGELTRNACTAGYKGIYQDGTYPSRDFLTALNPGFADFVADKIDRPMARLGDRVGSLTAAAAELTGLPEGIAVATGNVDAHVTAPAARAIEAGQMVAIMGTSTCHVMNGDVLARGARHVRRGRGRHHPGPVGLRGRPVRRRRHLRLVRRAPGARVLPGGRRAGRGLACTSTSPRSPASRRSASTAWSRSTGTAATARCSSTTTSPGWSSG